MIEKYYSEDNGRPSVDPVVVVKIAFLQHLFGIRSLRQTLKEVDTKHSISLVFTLQFKRKSATF